MYFPKGQEASVSKQYIMKRNYAQTSPKWDIIWISLNEYIAF